MEYKIRKIMEKEYELLEDFLYESIFIPEGTPALPKSVIHHPSLQVYLENFGKRKDDMGLVAEVDGKVVGAVWVRIMNDFGHVDDETPSLAISLYKEYRGLGIGTAMINEMLSKLKQMGYAKTSLSVQKANYAVKMYKKAGYEIFRENEEECIMISYLQ